jgi:hypothetical protein
VGVLMLRKISRLERERVGGEMYGFMKLKRMKDKMHTVYGSTDRNKRGKEDRITCFCGWNIQSNPVITTLVYTTPRI